METVTDWAGLALGLGGQQTAARITEGWYDSARQASRKVAEYTASQSDGPAAGMPVAGRPPTTPQAEPPITGGPGSRSGG
ncbi:MAG: hypothetical protein M3153_02995 [Chloroflexota bacterium]|nr:hypothetical protein [Chloroflexota bacterium]